MSEKITPEPPFGGRRLCAHAELNGEGSHWLEPGQECYLTAAERLVQEPPDDTEADTP